MKNVLVEVNCKVRILGVMVLVIKIELRNKKNDKVNDGMDILEGKSIRIRKDKG